MVNLVSFEQLHAQWPDIQLYSGATEQAINNLSVDSRKLKAGDGFIACVGHKQDGRQYIANAINMGVKLVVCEADALVESALDECIKNDVTCILVPNLNQRLSELAATVYQHPTRNLMTVGVTGTNGKSSCVQMLAQALHLLEGCCWSLGTLGCGPFGAQKPNDNTTADAVTIQRELAKAVSYGCGNAAMEVSSHGLVQGRVSAVEFNVAVFTNLTRDHLDYHHTMDAYGEAKRQLFLMPSLQWVVLNVDDRFGRKLKKDNAITAKKLFVTLKEPTSGADLDHWIWTDDIRLTLNGIKAKVYTPWGSGKLEVPLIGRFNLYNLLSVIAVLGTRLQNADALFETVNQLQSVNGRMQLIQQEQSPIVIVDYAHTPDALEQALKAAREHCSGKIITVFGCGGDRDPGKRPLMAKVAEKFSNRVIFTDDNPRTESAEKIISDMRAGLKRPEKVKYIADRKAAIEQAVALASESDLILVAGKGHEDYQIFGEEKVFFSDVIAAKEVLAERAA